jgi:hypothetical protein
MHSRLYVKMRVQVLNQSQKLKAQQLTQQFRLFTATQRHMSSQSLAKHFHNQDLLLLLFQTLPSHQHLLFQHLCRSTFQRLSVCTRYVYDPCFMNACTTSCHAHVLQLLLALQIILQTAKFVRQAGGQTEFVLRVKQAANPNFNFLEPSDLQHPYFRWLVSTKPEVQLCHANLQITCFCRASSL